MKDINISEKLWQDLASEWVKVPGAKHYLRKLKRYYQGKLEYLNEKYDEIKLTNGNTYEKAKAMLSAEMEEMILVDRLNRVKEKKAIRMRDFEITVYEEYGIDLEEENFTFNPLTGALIKNKTNKKENTPDSYKATLEGFKELVETALYNPLAAGNMVYDERLPHWLREMCEVIVCGSLKPALRKVIEECVKDPYISRKWNVISAEEDMAKWFVDMTSILGARKKWEV